MDAKIINPFIDSAMNVIQTMASITPRAGKPYLKNTPGTWGAVTGVIGMAGDRITGNMLISFDEECVLKIVSKMLMTEYTTINDEVVDAVGELTNIISGGAKTGLSMYGFKFEMATPVMLTGRGLEIRQLTNAPIIVAPFEIDRGRFVLEANLAPRKHVSDTGVVTDPMETKEG